MGFDFLYYYIIYIIWDIIIRNKSFGFFFNYLKVCNFVFFFYKRIIMKGDFWSIKNIILVGMLWKYVFLYIKYVYWMLL